MTKPHHAFTLIELLAAIAIVAILVVSATFFSMSYVQWAQNNADQRTLLVLNDALTRYKCEGGSIAALTAGAPIGHVISALQTPVSWAGTTHQFMQQAVTYPARSLSAAGNGSNYYFYQYNTYSSGTPSASTPTNTYPYGQGVGYMSNNSNASGYGVYFATGGGASYVACQPSTGSVIYVANGSTQVLPQVASYTFWACAGNSGTQPPAGTITTFAADSQAYTQGQPAHLTSLNVSGLTSLTILYCQNNLLTSLNVSGLTQLQQLYCNNNQLTSLNGVGACTLLQQFDCDTNQIGSSMNLNGLTALHTLNCEYNLLTSLSVRGCTSITFFLCDHNNLGNIDITGDTQTMAPFNYTPQNPSYTPNKIGP